MNNYARRLAELKAQPCHKLKEVGDQWRTPDWLYWGVFANFGPFVIDLFSDGDNAKCSRFYTAKDNALVQDWTKDLAGGKGFFNPPYSRSSYEDGQAITGMRNIIDKVMAERDKGAATVGVIKAATSEVWWPEEADSVVFIRGRIGFELPEWFIPADDDQKNTGASFASAICIFDKSYRGERIGYISREKLRQDGELMMRRVSHLPIPIGQLSQMLSGNIHHVITCIDMAVGLDMPDDAKRTVIMGVISKLNKEDAA